MAIPINGGGSLRLEYARLNRAYGCFAFLGLVTLPFGLAALLEAFGLINFDEGSGGLGETLSGWAYLGGILLGLPILTGMLGATIYGIRQTVRFRQTALVVLSVVSIVCVGGMTIFIPFSDLPGHRMLYRVMDYVIGIAFGIYIAANVLIPGWWFTKGRRRYKSEVLPRV